MNIIFFQYCISPHQMPYIQCLPHIDGVQDVVVVSPMVDLDERKSMGWHATDYGVPTLINPSDNVVCSLLSRYNGQETWCFFSGINAFVEIAHWMKMSLGYDVHRGVITEPPRVYHSPLWMHKVRFAIKDWRYVKHFDKVFVMGDDYVPYYQMWSRHWQVVPFMYCTEWRERTVQVPSSSILRVLFVGELCHRKNVSLLLDAVSGQDNIEIGIIGDGAERQMLEQKARAIKPKVTFYGSRPMSEVPDIMQQYDILVLPSRQDGWGAVVNEALTLGLYVICSDRCGAKYLLNDMKRGLVFHNADVDQLVDGINYCIKNLMSIRQSVKERIEWSEKNISGSAVAQYFYAQIK